MKKVIAGGVFILAVMAIGLYIGNSNNGKIGADTWPGTVSLSANVATQLTCAFSGETAIAFGTLVAGTPESSAGTTLACSTNAANGYTLGLDDAGPTATDSALKNTAADVYIPDYSGTLATPTAWTGTGLGITMTSASTNYLAKWSAGANYMGIPSTTTTAHTVNTPAASDASSWKFQIDVPGNQKAGTYSGTVNFTINTVL